jgi:hypothetical protein
MIVRWGHTALWIDNTLFAKGYTLGRELYKRDCQAVPQKRVMLNISDILHYVSIPGNDGHYHLDERAQGQVEEYMGVLTGYLSGALPDTSK